LNQGANDGSALSGGKAYTGVTDSAIAIAVIVDVRSKLGAAGGFIVEPGVQSFHTLHLAFQQVVTTSTQRWWNRRRVLGVQILSGQDEALVGMLFALHFRESEILDLGAVLHKNGNELPVVEVFVGRTISI
jgi:hypothetical protein